ncbi:MAG: ABC transporter ATP-binding protein [Clostridiales bacterium]|nr:ABC transporter ATP-binding protein [Clostridiales bacterium]
MKKDSDFKVLKRLFGLYAKHNRETIIACIILAFITGIRPYISIVLSGLLIDGLIDGKELNIILQYMVIGLLAVLGAQLLESYLREFFNARVENCMERQNRDLNEQSMEIDYENLENPELQEKKRKQEQVVNVRGGIYWMIIWPLDRGLTGLISVITAIVVAIPLFNLGIEATAYGFLSSNWLLMLLMIILGLGAYVSYSSSNKWNKKTKTTFEEYAKCNKVSNYFLHNILSGAETMKDLRIFEQEKIIEEGIFEKEEEAKGVLRKLRHLGIQQTSIENTISNISGGCVYLYAAMKAYMGLISIGSVVRYAGSIIKCVDGLVDILLALSYWRLAADYGRDYLDYIELKNTKEEGNLSLEESSDGRFQVEFDHVSFEYPGSDIYVIKDLSLKLDLGERMAIVGKNGSGKTTFIKLLCRLYDVTEGEIRLNGVNICKYNLNDYMRFFSVVFQDYRIFSLKVGENIAADENVDEPRAIDALNKAGLKERFEQMSEGLDTYVGKEFDGKGVNVSGGERQKMAIARAIYKGAPFVIMDEPTAALDPISECEVYAGFDKMVGNKAAIYISHRLASCRFCNDILVFDGGNIIQHGKHEELLRETGLYQKLWNAQAQYYQDSGNGAFQMS